MILNSIYLFTCNNILVMRFKQNTNCNVMIMIIFPYNCPSLLTIGRLTRINPLVVHVNWLGQKVYGCLEVLQTNSTLDPGRVFRFVHFHFTAFFVVTKRACEQDVQSLDGFVLWRRLSFRFSAAHFFVLWSENIFIIQVKFS